jgi:urease alpha subunit
MFTQVATSMGFFFVLMQVVMRPMFGAFGKAGSSNSIAFVSKVVFGSASIKKNDFLDFSN